MVLDHISEEVWFDDCTDIKEYLASVEENATVKNVTQISFWSVKSDKVKQSDFPKAVRKNSLLGVCVVITLQTKKKIGKLSNGEICSFVYESITRLPEVTEQEKNKRFLEDYCYIFSTNMKAVINGRRFDLNKPHLYFCQNDSGISSACSHTSLRMSLYHAHFRKHKETAYSEINSFIQRADSSLGLTTEETIGFLRDLELVPDCLWLNMEEGLGTDEPDTDEPSVKVSAYEFAYLLIESGIPTMIVFRPFLANPEHHVVSVVGHTTSYHEWLPLANAFYPEFDAVSIIEDSERGYASSSNWAPHLIVHDDILGPYHCLGDLDLIELKTIRNETVISSRIAHVIGMAPESFGFTASPYQIQQIAAAAFNDNWTKYLEHIPESWANRLRQEKGPLSEPSKLVLRTQLISREDYIEHLRTVHGRCTSRFKLKKIDRRTLQENLPNKFWMTEFTCPEVYSVHRAKLGEMLLKFAPTDAEIQQFGCGPNPICFGIRFINFLRIEVEKAYEIQLGFKSHTKLYNRRKHASQFE